MSSARFELSRVNYVRLLMAVAERDGYRCVICGSTSITPHHVDRRSSGGGDFLENLVCLCVDGKDCHGKVDRREISIPVIILKNIGYYNDNQKRLEL